MSSYNRRQELSEIEFEGCLLEGILGSTAEERREMKPRSPNSKNKQLNFLHRKFKTRLQDLIEVSESQNHKDYVIADSEFSKILKSLAEVSSGYPNLTDIEFKVMGLKILEGEDMIRKIRSYLIFIHFLTDSTFWRFLFTEPILQMLKGIRNNKGKKFEDIQTILMLYSVPPALTEWLLERFPDGQSIEKMNDYTYQNIINHISFSMVNSASYIKPKVRRKGYSKTASPPKVYRTKLGFEMQNERILMTWCPDLVNKEGELIMNKDVEESLQDYLLRLQLQSAETFLLALQELNRKKKLFQKQTETELLAIINDESLTPQTKVERIMKNERSKIKKYPDDTGKRTEQKEEPLRVYSTSSGENPFVTERSGNRAVSKGKINPARGETPKADQRPQGPRTFTII